METDAPKKAQTAFFLYIGSLRHTEEVKALNLSLPELTKVS